jgi:DNA replication initiation complex subunit (GINS family)
MRLNLFTEMFASMTVASTPDQVLLEGLDFLDQCVPRLKRLINASVSGKIKISEKTVGLLFSLNDDVSNLINTFIEAERGGFLDLEKAKKLIKTVKKETTTSTKEEDEDEEEQGPKPVAAPKIPKIQNQASTESVDHGDLLADIFDDVPPASTSSKDETATTTDLDDLFGLT